MKNVCFHLNRKLWATIAMLLVFTLPALAQKVTVHGTVLDELGEALIGATVMEKGTTNGTQTDLDGNFELRVDPNATLLFSYVGYNQLEEAVAGRTNINVVMSENSTMLSDVVVIGYGSVKKQDATGSVAMVMPDEVDANIATSAQDLLTGASPGVVVTSSGGSPEGGATIRIRGGSSLSASNDPLIVLDGVPLSNDGVNGAANPLAMISPDNIESMTILKDASATAIYGSRASNGVIIITTKKGKSGRPQVNFSANVTVSQARKTWDVLNGSQFTSMVKDYFGADSAAASLLGSADTDWQDEVLRTSISHDYNLSIGGKVGFLPYRVSGSYTMNNGILKNSQMQRVTAGVNLTPQFFDGLLKVSANVKGYYIKNKFTDESCVGTAMDCDPTRPVYSNIASGNSSFPYFYNGYSANLSGLDWQDQNTLNPLAQATDIDNTGSVYRSNGNLQIDYALHFLPDLHLNLNLGYDVSKGENNKYTAQNSPTAWDSCYKNGASQYYYSYELTRNTLLDFYANYKKEVESIYSNFDIMAGYSWQRFDAHGRNNQTEITSAGFYKPSLSNGVLTIDPSSESYIGKTYLDAPWYYWNNGRLQLLSFFGRLNYSFKDTYLLTFTLRDDGTSRFSKDNRWGLFPSVALGWKINNMPFMESVRENMNEFKLRLGWGQTGQQSVGGYFDYMPTYIVAQVGSYYPNMYTGTYANAYTYYPAGYNPNLKWETTTTWNAGLDMGWWNNRLTVALDWYLRNSKDLLATVTVFPGAATTNQMTQNVGSLRNIGLEATIGAKIIDTEDFTWSTSYNVAWNKNEITKLNNANDPDSQLLVGPSISGLGGNAQVHKVGYPAFTYWLYEQVYDEYGKPIEGAYVDQNGDGIINDDDKVYKHSRDPKVTMSWNNTFSFKNWDLSFQLRANIGNYVYNRALAQRSYKDGMYSNNVLHNLVVADTYFNSQAWESDYWLENAGFVRCDNITLGYTWPDLLGNKLRLRLYGAVQNPFVITRYRGIDPEIFDGVDTNVYPRPVSYTIGLIATF
jgi:iron complex outermembrane receptor protein